MQQTQERPAVRRTEDEVVVEVSAPEDIRRERKVEPIDDLLDEIDDVLETNAEAFVAGFVQRGGE